MREEAQKGGAWNRANIYTYPPPENVGITLDIERGNQVKAVTPGSAADKAGFKPGDFLHSLNQVNVHSFANASYALDTPAKGRSRPSLSAGKPIESKLILEPKWRWTNITWRPSLFDLLPSLTVYGDDLTAAEKKALGLSEKRLAFRQQADVHRNARAMGVEAGDIILGIDNRTLEMSMQEFLGHVRQNFLVGETLTLNLLRGGKRVDLKIQLK